MSPRRDSPKDFIIGTIELVLIIVAIGVVFALCNRPVEVTGNPCYPQEPDVIDGELFCR
jgi:hypothetical protein